ncbi:hypothetical protein JCM33374_g1469 [Metschnikowia sp. JCM 33374]|nr:hypothetical protein JCM33374_g1469 [Metschnikowia sp. JCM 33374]
MVERGDSLYSGWIRTIIRLHPAMDDGASNHGNWGGWGGVNIFSGKIETKLISSGRHAICRIPSLAPHFGPISNIPYNKETKMVPVMGVGTSELSASEDEKSSPMYGKHS